MLKVSINFVNGDHNSFNEHESILTRLATLRRSGYEGKELVDELLTDDWGPPPVVVKIEGTLEDGTVVEERIPYD